MNKNELNEYTKQAMLVLTHKPIKGRDLAKEIGCRYKDLPDVIHVLRDRYSFPVAISNKGYHIATQASELQRTISKLRQNIKSRVKAIKGLKRAMIELTNLELKGIEK